MSEYTPTTDEVREDFAYPWEGFKQNREGRLAAFDRWLAQVKAKALREAAQMAPFPIDPYGGFDGASLSAARTQITHWLRDCADEIERATT